jgi:hypothetical protein
MSDINEICTRCPSRGNTCRTPVRFFPMCMYNPVYAKYRHECPECHFLGAFLPDGRTRYDLYAHNIGVDGRKLLLSRYDCRGSDIDEIYSHLETSHPGLMECKHRAVSWGLIEELP